MSRSERSIAPAVPEEIRTLADRLRAGLDPAPVLGAIAPDAVPAALEWLVEAAPRDPVERAAFRELALSILDAGRWPSFLTRISGTPLAERWLLAVLRAIGGYRLSFGDLFRLRVSQKPDRVQVVVPQGGSERKITRGELGEEVAAAAAGLRALLPDPPGRVPVALFTANRWEAMVADLACLTGGIVDVPIPADATPDQVRAILDATEPAVLVVSDAARLEEVASGGPLAGVRTIVLLDPPERAAGGRPAPLLFRDLIEGARSKPFPPPESVDPDAPATIMFTSGTTGRPKGIRFCQRNLLYKRFCRAVALPEIGEEDRFLCYLPLFHTFGRYLEMTGTLFWGATYLFMGNPSKEAMLRGMSRYEPTAMISIPKRWIQLHETILQAAGDGVENLDEIDADRLGGAVRRVTGGCLRWGLSAAGHLDPDLFEFFHRFGIEVMSGFGMTEATGGITMTPPRRYRRGTVGVPLPGIELRLAEDGELLARGPYMMIGYDDEPPVDLTVEWFATGDIFHVDRDGYYSIVDRKKDIYKNVKGQTIAPQKIENLFNEFDEILRVFLVGDGREYNTLLVYPNYEASDGKLAKMDDAELRDYISSYVVSVNRFLAPFERVVDFDLLPRFFREDRGELTRKGTFVRKVVERNFADRIDALYARPYVTVQVGGIDVRVPSWLLREKGVTTEDLLGEAGGIRLRHAGQSVKIAREGTRPGRFRIGSLLYQIDSEFASGDAPPVVDLDPLLRVPAYWVGNLELAHFAGEDLLRRPRRGEPPAQRISVQGLLRPALIAGGPRDRLREMERDADGGPSAVHAAIGALLISREEEAAERFAALDRFLENPAEEQALLTIGFLPLLRDHPFPEIRRRALALLLPHGPSERVADTLRRFLSADPDVLAGTVRARLLEADLSPASIRAILDTARDFEPIPDEADPSATRKRVVSLLRLAGEIGSRHPSWYASARQVLVLRAATTSDEEIGACAREERGRLDRELRDWIAGSPLRPAAREETTPEPYERIVAFDDRVEEEVRERLLAALEGTTLLRESGFLLCEETLLSRADLLPGGIWVSYLGSGHGKTVVRFTVRMRNGRVCEFVAKVLRRIDPEEAEAEANWIIRLGTREREVRLVPEFGGFWPEHGVWSEEYLSNETVLATLKRLTRAATPARNERLLAVWPHLAWSALATFVEFWHRSGRKVVLAEPVPFNIVVAPHDYQEGSRLVSVSARAEFRGVAEMIRFSYEGFVESTEAAFPALKGFVPRRIAFAAVLEALGEADGVALLWRALAEMREKIEAVGGGRGWRRWHNDLARWLDEVERDGCAPRRLVMAVRRYRTWITLNAGASLQARAVTLQEIYDTYSLPGLEAQHPEIRIRFFRMTVFSEAAPGIARELDALIRDHRDSPLGLDALLRRMTVLHQTVELSEEEAYFLARMTYSHLKPAQRVRFDLHEEGGKTTADLVEEVADDEGGILWIRSAANPKEVMRLHHHFEQSGLSVVFRPEHQFLLGVDEHDVVIGGLFYRQGDPTTAHMEKIVVSPRYRGRGAGDRLMESFMERMRDAKLSRVTTGFFRPHYFYRFGFRLERGTAGLVKDLRDGPARDPDAADATPADFRSGTSADRERP